MGLKDKQGRGDIFYLYPLFFFIFFIFQSKTINTGDAGELVGASFGLGIAHPSGYPIYLIISKFLTFLPFGNIYLKVTLVSSLSATLLIVLGMKFLKKENFSYCVLFFFAFLLLSSYSFFGQSLVAKFYPLNTVLIFFIFALGYNLLKEFNLKYQLIIFFLLGLSAGLHHTTFFMVIPLSFIAVLYFKQFIKGLIPSIGFFFLGLANVLYLLVRSWRQTLINLSPSPDLHSLVHTLLRKAYGSSSSVEAAKSILFLNLNRLICSIKNMFLLLNKQFFWYSWVFFLCGLIFLYKKDKKRFVYFLLSFLTYSIFLGYITFSSKKPDINAWYICAHQYYLPLFFFYALICGFGFAYIITLLPLKIEKIKYVLLLLPLFFFPQNIFLNFYDKNQVAYYKTIDQLFVKPIKTIVVFSGDNDVFQSWYMKNVEKFRDDLCILSAPKIGDEVWGISNGCNEMIYKDFYPQVFEDKTKLNLAGLKGYMKNKRFWSSYPVEDNKILKKHLVSFYSIIDFVVVPKDFKNKKELKSWSSKARQEYKNFIHYQMCFDHGTDDVFTKAICIKYSTFFTYYAYDLNNDKNDISYKKFKIKINFSPTYISKLTINVDKNNIQYLYIANRIKENNKIDNFYLFKGF